MADELADQGVRLHGVRLWGQKQPMLKRPAGWPRDRGDQEQGSQGLAPPVAAAQGVPPAPPQQQHTGGGVQRLLFISYVDIEDQRRDEGLRYAVYLAHRSEAAALRKAEVDEWRQLLARMHYVQRQGLQWEWYYGSKGMLEG